jgi:hypothetical protein
MYYTQWNRKIETVHPITYAKRWENRIQASHSIYRPPPVDKRTAKVFDYPEVSEGGLFSKGNIFSVPSILSNTTVSGYAAANDRLCIHNALLGKDYKVRVWLLIWGPGGTLDDAMKQEQYWLRGNKNELVICCGLSEGNKVKWAYVFSWTDEEIIKINCREKVLEQSGQPVDLMKIVDWLPSEIQIHWKKKDFHEFDYLTVEPPIGWVIFVYILTMFACAGTTLFAVLNQIDPERKDDVHWRDVECFGRRLTFVNTCGRIQNVARSLATDFRLLCADMRRWIRRR